MSGTRRGWIVPALVAASFLTLLTPRASSAQESLVIACHYLAQADPGEHAGRCAGNAAVSSSIRLLGQRAIAITSRPVEAAPFQDPDRRRAWAEAFANEIADLSADGSRMRSTALSVRVLEAFRAYDANPARWLALESDMMAAHAALAALPAAQRRTAGLDPMPSFVDWRAVILSDRDLPHALAYASAALTRGSPPREAVPELPFAEDLECTRYLEDAAASFRRERDRRTSSGPRTVAAALPPAAASLSSDPEFRQQPSAAERFFRVRLAEGRYRGPAATPPLVARLTIGFIAEVHDADLARARDLYQRLARQNDIAALSSVPLTAAQRTWLDQARADTLAALTRLDAVIRVHEQCGYAWSDGGKRDLAALVAALGGPASRGGAPVRDLFETASTSLAGAEAALAKVDTTARPIGADKGRLVISREQARSVPADVGAIDTQTNASRLPERLHAWPGFINARTGKPYDYERDVKDFRNFAPVGGGVHMGATARAASNTDLRHYVLTYDVATKTLMLAGDAGDRLTYGPVEPDVLKVLYRFSSSGRNAAISIGWSGQFDPSTNGRRGEAPPAQPILLDPIFADTRVGQDLIAADALAWDPDGIAEPFRQAHQRFIERRIALLDRFCRNVPPLTYASGLLMSGAFAPGKRATYLDLLVFSVLTHKTVPAAKTAFLSETNYEVLAHEDLLRGRHKNSEEGRKIRTAKAAIEGLVKLLNDSQDRLQILASAAAYAMEDGEADVKWIQLFTSALRAQKRTSSADIAAAIYEALPTTTLAVLLDEAPQLRVEAGRLRLDGAMRYRYATSLIRVDNGLLVMSEGAGANRTRVETIAELTDLANAAMPAMLQHSQPLQRVSEYSRILALLRWARQPGHVLAIDFADLGQVRPSDRDATPTADEITHLR